MGTADTIMLYVILNTHTMREIFNYSHCVMRKTCMKYLTACKCSRSLAKQCVAFICNPSWWCVLTVNTLQQKILLDTNITSSNLRHATNAHVWVYCACASQAGLHYQFSLLSVQHLLAKPVVRGTQCLPSNILIIIPLAKQADPVKVSLTSILAF